MTIRNGLEYGWLSNLILGRKKANIGVKKEDSTNEKGKQANKERFMHYHKILVEHEIRDLVISVKNKSDSVATIYEGDWIWF